MGRGATKRGGGAYEVLPLQKGGGEVLAMLKGGTKSYEVVFTQELEVLAIGIGGGGEKSLWDQFYFFAQDFNSL